MESVMILESQDQIARDLHEATDRIRCVLSQLCPQTPQEAAKVASPQQMSDLLSGLMRAGQWLRVLPANRDRNLDEQICAYRNEVEQLRSFLPAMQASLLAERGRLEHERERLNGAAAWAQASSQTVK